MSLQVRLALRGNLKKFADDTKIRILTGARDARDIMGTRLKLRLRDDVRAGGLGDRLANTWRYEGYPQGRRLAYHPAGLVFSKAPLIIGSFAADTTILPRQGAYLAIPTENVPRRGRAGGRGQASHWTVKEVESFYRQKLILIRSKSGNGFVGFIDKTLTRRKARWGRLVNKTRPEPEQRRDVRLWPMFVFVKQVHLRKRLDFSRIVKDAQVSWQTIMATEIARQLEAA